MLNNKSLSYLGTRVDLGVSKDNIDNILTRLLKKGNSKIYTLNPEFIVDAFFKTDFQKELNSSDLNLIDGVGLLYGIKLLFKKKKIDETASDLATLTGVDLVNIILQKANRENLTVFLLGGSSEHQVAHRAALNLQKQYPNVKFVGYSSDFSHEKTSDRASVEFIKDFMKNRGISSIDFLLVGYGHQNQEFWIGRNSTKIPAKVSVGVGGTLDYLSGHFKRAPHLFRNLGLEWVYRLIIQPSRIFRILKATLLFTFLSIFYIKKPSKK